jgi:hypothetical protein
MTAPYETWQPGKKGCPRCLQWLDPSEFSKASHTLDGLQGWCKACMVKRTREWRQVRRRA